MVCSDQVSLAEPSELDNYRDEFKAAKEAGVEGRSNIFYGNSRQPWQN